jgi:hypothetical protein
MEKNHAGTPFGVSGSDGTSYLLKAAQTSGELMQQNTYSIYKGPAERIRCTFQSNESFRKPGGNALEKIRYQLANC